MGKVVAAKDWSTTPLGPVESWSAGLRTTMSLALASTFPIDIVWGPGHVQIYNDGYWPICGAKHPTSMGQDFRDCWASAMPVIGAEYERAWAGEASYVENQRIELASVFRAAIDRAGLELVLRCEPLDEAVYVDREMWEKIVLNLVSNAFKFTFKGKIEVALRRSGDHVELTVCDTGTGVSWLAGWLAGWLRTRSKGSAHLAGVSDPCGSSFGTFLQTAAIHRERR